MSSCTYSPANLNSLSTASYPVRRMVPAQPLPRMAGSSARRGYDLTQTGIESYSVLANTEAPDAEFGAQIDVTNSSCVDCSNVDNATFSKECVRDRNVGYATMRFAHCGIKANRQINQDNGSRQTDKIDQRESIAYNLTDPGSVVINQAMQVSGAAADPLGRLRPARAGDPLGKLMPASAMGAGADPLGALLPAAAWIGGYPISKKL